MHSSLSPNMANAETKLHGFAHRFEHTIHGYRHITEAVFLFMVGGEILRQGTEIVVSKAPIGSQLITSYRQACDLAVNLHEAPVNQANQLQWVDKFPWQQVAH